MVDPLEVTPGGETKTGILRSIAFTANVDVDWSVTEDDGGAIDAAGLYLSPTTPGTYHVVATSQADAGESVEVVVVVVPLGAEVVGGIPGGPGNLNGGPSRARFSAPRGLALFDSASTQVIADTENSTIRVWESSENEVRTLAGRAGERDLVDGAADVARFYRPTAMVADEDNNRVYVLDGSDDYGPSCVRVVSITDGTTTTLAGSCDTTGSSDAVVGTAARFGGLGGITLAPDGSGVYVCQSNFNPRALRHVSGAGSTLTISGTAGGVGCNAVATDHYRDLVYVATGANDRQIKSINMSRPIAAVTNVVEVPGTDSQISGMTALTASGNDDELYVFDLDDDFAGGLWSFRFGGAPFMQIGGGGFGYADGPLVDARFGFPGQVIGERNRSALFFTDPYGSTVRRVDFNDDTMDTTLGVPRNIVPIDGPRTEARLVGAFSLALAEDESSAYAASFNRFQDGTIRRIDMDTGAIETFSGVRGDLPPIDGQAADAVFGQIFDIVRVGDALYVADGSQTIRKVDLETGSVETIAGVFGEAGNVDGFGTQARFSFVGEYAQFLGDPVGAGLATDGVDLYVADGGNHTIRKIDISLGEVTTIAGTGTEGSVDGVGDLAQFVTPAGLAIDGGVLYIADAGDHAIRAMDLASAEVSTLTGQTGELGQVDGDSIAARFTAPTRLVADGLGNLYVTGFGYQARATHTIRRIDLATTETSTLAGSTSDVGFAAGPLPTSLNCPAALVVDGAGDLLFADACDGVIGALRPL